MKLKIVVAILILTAVGLAQNGGSPMVVPANESNRLRWENHRLKAANLRLQADAEDKAADAELEAMQRAAGEKYAPRLNQQGQLEFVLKEPVKPVSTGTPTVVEPPKPDTKKP